MNEKVVMKKQEKLNMWLLIAGMGVSRIGSLAFSFAVGLYILNLTGSGMSFAISMVLSALPRVLVSPIAGILADKYSKKVIVVFGDLISGVLVLILLVQTEITVTSLYAIICLLSIANTFFSVAVQASLPNLVKGENLMTINSSFEAFRSIASIIGPLLGGVLFGFGSLRVIILINGLSFILSGLSEMFIDFKYNSSLSLEEMAEEKSFNTVFVYLKEEPVFIFMLTMSLSFNFLLTLGINVPHTYMMNNVLKLAPKSIGIIEATISIGIIIGSIIVSKFVKDDIFKWLCIGSVGLGLSVVLSGLPYLFYMGFSELSNVLYQSLVLVLAGFFLAVVNVPVGTKMQQMAPEKLRGRLFSLFGMIGSALVPFGLLISGFLIQYVLPQYLIVTCGLLMVVISLYFLSKPQMKALFNSEKKVDSNGVAEVL